MTHPFQQSSEPAARAFGRPAAPYVVTVDSPLREPLDGSLRDVVRALLHRGERTIVLDLTRVPTVDAAGVGELVRAYNMTIAPNGTLQIVHARAWVREMLERAGLFEILSDTP